MAKKNKVRKITEAEYVKYLADIEQDNGKETM